MEKLASIFSASNYKQKRRVLQLFSNSINSAKLQQNLQTSVLFTEKRRARTERHILTLKEVVIDITVAMC